MTHDDRFRPAYHVAGRRGVAAHGQIVHGDGSFTGHVAIDGEVAGDIDGIMGHHVTQHVDVGARKAAQPTPDIDGFELNHSHVLKHVNITVEIDELGSDIDVIADHVRRDRQRGHCGGS